MFEAALSSFAVVAVSEMGACVLTVTFFCFAIWTLKPLFFLFGIASAVPTKGLFAP